MKTRRSNPLHIPMHRYLHCPRLGSAFYIDGPMVKRLRHHPFTVVTWVQVPLGSPFRHTKKERRQTLLFCVFFRFFGLFWAFFAEKILFILFDIRAGRDLFPSSFFSSFRIFQKIFFIRSFRSCRLYKSALCFSQGALCLFFHEKSYRFKVILS